MSSSTKKQQAGAQEIALGRIAQQKDARFESAFRPLEKRAIAELDSADAGKRGQLLAGRSAADVNQQAAHMPATRTEHAMRRGTNIASGMASHASGQNRAIADATSTAVTDGFTMGRASMDDDMLNVIATGQNVSRSSQAGVTAAARFENQRARSILNARNTVDFAKGAAIGDLVTAGAVRHLDEKDNATRPGRVPVGGGEAPRYGVPDSDLNFYSRFLRQRHERRG
jgi:hypothetical protein